MLAEVRRLVHGLRPPALDELGLAEALRQFATTIGQGGSVRMQVDAPATLPPLPAAVEVAAYRIVQEAVTNVVRHAKGALCCGAGQNHAELIAAAAKNVIGVSHGALQNPRDLGEHLVAYKMTIAVVDTLEGIDIDHQQR